MQKKRIDVTIDLDIFFELQTRDINRSDLINNFFRYYLIKDNPGHKLKVELKKFEKEKEKLDEKIAIIRFKLNTGKKIKGEKQKEQEKEELEEAKQLAKGIKASGMLAED